MTQLAISAPRSLEQLDRGQWAAALKAARILRECDPHVEHDRAEYREAKAALVQMLPADADATELIAQAIRWYALNDVALAFSGMQRAEMVQ